jgi:hypothetical protein
VSCATCKDTFAALAALKGTQQFTQTALQLDAREPECRCEGTSVSNHSPRMVSNTEYLLQILVTPAHIDKKTGQPKATALSHAETIGLSVLREGHATDDEIKSTAKILVENLKSKSDVKNLSKIGVFGILRLNCGILRDFVSPEENSSCYCVYDTAFVEVPSHADAFQRIENAVDGLPDARRRALFEQVKKDFIPVQQFRNGLLNELAPQVLR